MDPLYLNWYENLSRKLPFLPNKKEILKSSENFVDQFKTARKIDVLKIIQICDIFHQLGVVLKSSQGSPYSQKLRYIEFKKVSPYFDVYLTAVKFKILNLLHLEKKLWHENFFAFKTDDNCQGKINFVN